MSSERSTETSWTPWRLAFATIGGFILLVGIVSLANILAGGGS